VAEIGGPPILGVGHQGVEILDHGVQVEALEFLGVVERLAHRIGARRMLAKAIEAQVVGPPVPVHPARASMRDGALAAGIVCHVCLPSNLLVSAAGKGAPRAARTVGRRFPDKA
jgi:hypothetical protein